MYNIKLPKSSLRILSILTTSERGISPSEIVLLTSMNPRTVRYGLKRLMEEDIVEKRSSLHDMRFNKYSIRKDLETAIQNSLLMNIIR